MEQKICAARDCEVRFAPITAWQKYHDHDCANRERVRRYLERHKTGPNGGPPKGPSRQRVLFPAAMGQAKPPKTAVAQKDLFPVSKRMAVSA